MPNAATATPAANDVLPQWDNSGGFGEREGNAAKHQPKQQTSGDRRSDQPGMNQAGCAEVEAAVNEVGQAVEHMGPRHKNHTRAECDEAQRGDELKAERDGRENAGEQ